MQLWVVSLQFSHLSSSFGRPKPPDCSLKRPEHDCWKLEVSPCSTSRSWNCMFNRIYPRCAPNSPKNALSHGWNGTQVVAGELWLRSARSAARKLQNPPTKRPATWGKWSIWTPLRSQRPPYTSRQHAIGYRCYVWPMAGLACAWQLARRSLLGPKQLGPDDDLLYRHHID